MVFARVVTQRRLIVPLATVVFIVKIPEVLAPHTWYVGRTYEYIEYLIRPTN